MQRNFSFKYSQLEEQGTEFLFVFMAIFFCANTAENIQRKKNKHEKRQ